MQVGKVERKNMDVMDHLRAIVAHRRVRDKWSRCLPLIQRIIMHTYHRPIGTTPYLYVYGSKAALNHGLLLPATVPLKASVEDLIQQLDSDLSAVVEASLEYRARYTAERMLAQPASTSVYPDNSYVLVKYPGRSPKLSKWRGPFLVLSHAGNAYAVQDLVTMENLSFDVSFLKPFDASTHSADKLTEIARADTSEEVIDYIVSYTGNPKKKSTLEFRLHWKDSEPADDTYHLPLASSNIKDCCPGCFYCPPSRAACP
jgi:hypothetical protein